MKRVLLLLLKAVPVVGALCCAASSLLSYYGIDLGWMGFVAQVFFFLSWLALAFYFRFCTFYYLLVMYIAVNQAFNIIDYIYYIPLSDRGCFVFHCGLIGLMIIIFTYIHVRDTRALKKHLAQRR